MYVLQTKSLIQAPLEEVWDFFSSPHNLQKITPKSMGFQILTGGEGKMYPGQIISYRVNPVPGISTLWVTEISHVEDKVFFVDEQRIGPYAMWHHEHHFKQTEKGVEMTDIVSYHLPLGLLGKFAHWLFVKKKVARIFKYRETVLPNFFKVG
ncbi:MAG: SRPBCC family protein [Bacteroidetes bacterium]|jgi:ligand-binding SRPBCC domain-containing protein|nr:SRPBCC family protein [Bacteroidota bacterium]